MIRLFEGDAHAAAYAKFRPKAPEILAQRIVKYLKEKQASFDCMLDVGCGNGQGTSLFASHFTNVMGIDVSPNQVEWANKHNKCTNITYSVGDGEHLPVPDSSVDLVASLQAVHWFDFDQFMKECRRVLKPKGCLLLYGYDIPYMYPIDLVSQRSKDDLANLGKNLIQDFYGKCKFHPAVQKLEKRYVDIYDAISSEDKLRYDDMKIETDMNLFEYKAYFSSWSGYQTYMKEKRLELIEKYGNDEKIDEYDVRLEFIANCKKAWELEAIPNENINVHVIFEAFCIMSTKPK